MTGKKRKSIRRTPDLTVEGESLTVFMDKPRAGRRTTSEGVVTSYDPAVTALAERVRAAVAAEAQRLLNEAENVLTDEARYSLFRRKLLDKVEGIVRESVKPMEKIEGIRILSLDGFNGAAGGGGGRSATDEVIDSALRYRVQAPLIDSILSEIGVEGGSLSKMGGLIREARDMQGIRKDTAPKPPTGEDKKG